MHWSLMTAMKQNGTIRVLIADDQNILREAIRRRLENQPNLTLFQQAVDDLMLEGDRVVGAMRRWHDGTDMGVVWQIVIFLGGIIPALLSVTEAIRASRRGRTRS